MATFSKNFLSVAPLGQAIQLGSTSTPIHTAPSGSVDEIWLYAVNNNGSSSSYLCTIVLPQGASINTTIDGSAGLVLVIPGLIIAGGQSLSGFTTDGNPWINVCGFVNRIT